MKWILTAASLLVLAGCTKAIIASPESQNIKVVTAAQKKRCDFVKTVSATQFIGPDKKGDALKMALNEAGGIGANAFYVISTTEEGGVKGTTVLGEALRCKF